MIANRDVAVLQILGKTLNNQQKLLHTPLFTSLSVLFPDYFAIASIKRINDTLIVGVISTLTMASIATAATLKVSVERERNP
ncbi:hypothetical protein F8S12_38775 [Nostoc sp. WHI]|nr:hypothetical protein [Nostoc sp. WHI]